MQPGASPRAFVDRPVTDIAGAERAARRAARSWALPDPELVRAGMNAIFASGGVVLRVGSPNVDAHATLDLAQFWLGRGLTVPRPASDDVIVAGDFSITCWERIPSVEARVDWSSVGAMVRRVHLTEPHELPDGVPLPEPASFPWWDFDALCSEVDDALDPAAAMGLRAAIERHRGWRHLGSPVVCHGDVHPGNVIMSVEGPVLIDWDLLCWAPPGWDHGPLMTLATRWGGDADAYRQFSEGYGRTFEDDPAAVAFAELRLVAATLMRVAAGIRDPVAMVEARRRLRYWRGDPDAPVWSAQ